MALVLFVSEPKHVARASMGDYRHGNSPFFGDAIHA